MPSAALARWSSTGLTRLDELERVHSSATGTRPGRRWGTDQLNRSLFVALVAQFQTYCRDLHDEAVDVHVSYSMPQQSELLRTLLSQGRKLDSQTPRSSTLGSDFGRLGFPLIEAVKAVGSAAEEDLHRLDVLCDFRNAIGHGNETEVTAIVSQGEIKATKTIYKRYRRTLDRLAGTLDRVVADEMGRLLAIQAPW